MLIPERKQLSMEKHNKMSRCGKKKKLNSKGAYSVWKDEDRLNVNKKIEKYVSEGFLPNKSGIFLTEDNESLPVFAPVGAIEKVISRTTQVDPTTGDGGPAGARIVLTKDNYGHQGTGLGGLGATMCEAIDIVAGSLSCEKRLKTGNCASRANFVTDGARIYLTERGDIQNYFALGEASKAASVSSMLKSGIGIKADHTLIIGRELVRIAAGLCNANGDPCLVNQQNYKTGVKPRIEIAAINQNKSGDVQPAVLGHALETQIDSLRDYINSFGDKIHKLETDIVKLRFLLAGHFHQGFGLGYISTVPDPQLVADAASNVATYVNTTTENVIDRMNAELDRLKHGGIKDKNTRESILKGGDPLTSQTVFIGK